MRVGTLKPDSEIFVMSFTRCWLASLASLALFTIVPAEARAQVAKTTAAVSALPWDARAVEHLLNRAGFGATPADIDAALALGREAFLAKLFNGFAPDAAPFDLQEPVRPTPEERRTMTEEQRKATYRTLRRDDNQQLIDYAGWWFDQMTSQRHPLRERMVLFWSGLFTSSAKEVKNGEAMIRQNQLFHANALGSYADLLHAIVRDPAMLVYLNNTKNTRAAPNENLARELMELFSLGEGHYSEADVKEAARALTGNTERDAQYSFNSRQHDAGKKTVLGVSGALDADQLVDILLKQDACPRWVSGKLLEHFEGRTPPKERVEEYAKFLRANNYRVDAFLKKLFDDPVFYSPEVVGQRIVGPIEFMVANCRRLGVNPPGGVIAAGAAQIGQQVFGPPNVKGWDGGRAWITTSTFLQRGNLVGMLLGVTKAQDIFKEDPALLGEEDPPMDGAAMEPGDGDGDAMQPTPPPEPSSAKAKGKKNQGQGDKGLGGAALRLMESSRWRRDLDLRERCRTSGATSDAAIVDRLATDLLAVDLSPEARVALIEFVHGERASLNIEEGQLLEKKAYGEATCRELAHLILSLPEAQLN